MKTNPANNMYCLVSFNPNPAIAPKILEVQGVVWFGSEDLAWQYWGFLNEEYRNKQGSVYTVKEENLCYHFNEDSDYIKRMKTRTRLTSNAPEPGVKVSTGDGEPNYRWGDHLDEIKSIQKMLDNK